jgi:hypothetical protein
MSNGGVPRALSVPRVALHYRYEPITALALIRRLCGQYGVVNVEPWVPARVLAHALRGDERR